MLRTFITDDKKQQIFSSIFIKVVLFPKETERARESVKIKKEGLI